MFIVFEGIDGSGKTTISNRVMAQLQSQGLDVKHLRAEGRFASSVTEAMRSLGRDSRNLELDPIGGYPPGRQLFPVCDSHVCHNGSGTSRPHVTTPRWPATRLLMTSGFMPGPRRVRPDGRPESSSRLPPAAETSPPPPRKFQTSASTTAGTATTRIHGRWPT